MGELVRHLCAWVRWLGGSSGSDQVVVDFQRNGLIFQVELMNGMNMYNGRWLGSLSGGGRPPAQWTHLPGRVDDRMYMYNGEVVR